MESDDDNDDAPETDPEAPARRDSGHVTGKTYISEQRTFVNIGDRCARRDPDDRGSGLVLGGGMAGRLLPTTLMVMHQR